MSQPALPPYGVPPGPPLPPRRRRPSGWWFVLGGGLVVAAVAAGIGLLVWTISGFLSVDASVAADGQPHEVSVPTDGERFLWVRSGGERPSCAIVDLDSGRDVEQRRPDGSYNRDNGHGAATVQSRFAPGSGRLEVTCTRDGGTVEIGPATGAARFVGGIFATILVPLGLGMLGLLVLVVTGVLFATGAPRREARNIQP
jgi:hypothetical protein